MKRSILPAALIFLITILVGIATSNPPRPNTTTTSTYQNVGAFPVGISKQPTPTPYIAKDNNAYIKLENIPPQFREIFRELSTFVSTKTRPLNTWLVNDRGVWWISQNNFNIINSNAYALVANFACRNNKLVEFNEAKEIFTPKTTEIMQKNGFTINMVNSSQSLEDKKFYDYVQGYEKGDTKCTLTISPDCSGNDEFSIYQPITFACTENYLDNKEKQEPFLRDLEITQGIIHVSQQIGDYAKIQVHFRRTGSYKIAMKKDGRWIELYSGQDTPSCKIMKEYQVPTELYDNCF